MIYTFIALVAIASALYHYAHHRTTSESEDIANAVISGVEFAAMSYIASIVMLLVFVLLAVHFGWWGAS